jgi:hypothetical protein
MKCPICNLISPDSALRCGCGHEFTDGAENNSASNSPRKQILSALGAAFVSIGIVVAVAVGVSLFLPFSRKETNKDKPVKRNDLSGGMQAIPPNMKMHRIQAGEPDASGWIVAASTEGGFSVRLPLKFNDFTLEASDAKDEMLRSFGIGSKSQEGIIFSATRVVYRKGAESSKHHFSTIENGQDRDLTPESVTPRRIGGRPAVDFAYKRASDVAYQRVILLESDLLMLFVDSPRVHEATARQLADAFFDSLVVTVK